MKCFILMMLTLSTTPVFAVGGVDTNGGDMCEDRFKIVRDDLNTWILNGGSQGLKLPSEVTLDRYNLTMLNKISRAKISCTEDVIQIGSAEKTCKNFSDTDGSPHIVCNTRRFLDTSESDQYVLVHHEYAGLAGFEVNEGEGSTYSISNQIAEYLENQTVKKLRVKPNATGPFDPNACPGHVITPTEYLSLFGSGARQRDMQPTVVITRRRSCLGNTEDLCTPWSYQELSNPPELSKTVLTLFLDQSTGHTEAEAMISGYWLGGVIQGIFNDTISAGLHGGAARDDRAFTGRFTQNCLVMTNQDDREDQYAIQFLF
jgi:hypothetical protein